jgi:hypothetical protein
MIHNDKYKSNQNIIYYFHILYSTEIVNMYSFHILYSSGPVSPEHEGGNGRMKVYAKV